ncbi:hypothetical protein DKX38_004020 [Salix brachista]|uniref:Uncharacterized protein n=1 Tax=Salix brachista TaxID=2182728 RepID=A0A5N5NC74_9ROSI|nr:hypothetical protein DKX38_004020 [Salix brachista]
MARLLSNAILKGISRASQSPRIVPASLKHVELRFSTTIPNDPDSHADFQPNNKAVNESGSCSGINIKELVDKDVKEHPVVIYMKGYPDLPQCGFSSLAVRVLKQYNVRSLWQPQILPSISSSVISATSASSLACHNAKLTWKCTKLMYCLVIADVPLTARNILEYPDLRTGVKAYRSVRISLLKLNSLQWYCRSSLASSFLLVKAIISSLMMLKYLSACNWPTFPQIFIKGEFIGGSDIIMNMHQTGELKEKFQDIEGKEESE